MGSGSFGRGWSAPAGWLFRVELDRTVAERIRGEKKKLRQACACRSFFFGAGPRSDPLHLRCLRSFLSLDDLEFHLIAFGQ
jgi:hypothetical protein